MSCKCFGSKAPQITGQHTLVANLFLIDGNAKASTRMLQQETQIVDLFESQSLVTILFIIYVKCYNFAMMHKVTNLFRTLKMTHLWAR